MQKNETSIFSNSYCLLQLKKAPYARSEEMYHTPTSDSQIPHTGLIKSQSLCLKFLKRYNNTSLLNKCSDKFLYCHHS